MFEDRMMAYYLKLLENKTTFSRNDLLQTMKENNNEISEASFKVKLQKMLKKGEIVPVFLPNIPEARTTIYALNLIGAISYPINPLISPKDFENIIVKNDVKNIFMFNMFYFKFLMLSFCNW